MKTSTSNRNEAFLIKKETISENRLKVYNLVRRDGPITAQRLASKLFWNINQVSGRLTELSNTFFIKSTGSEKNDYSKVPNTLWKAITRKSERIDLINSRFVELREERDTLINDLNISELSKTTKGIARNRIKQVNRLIKKLEKAL